MYKNIIIASTLYSFYKGVKNNDIIPYTIFGILIGISSPISFPLIVVNSFYKYIW